MKSAAARWQRRSADEMDDSGSAAPAQKPSAEWEAEARAAIAAGELLRAYDLCERALGENRDDPKLRYLAVLSLARAGATRQARVRYDSFGLAAVAGPAPSTPFEIDVAALDARIAKDDALDASGADRVPKLLEAAARYGAIFQRTRDYYPGINAATLSLIAGDAAKSRSLAREVMEACSAALTQGDSYYIAATQAEAALLLGDLDTAGAALTRAAASHGNDFSAVATTRRQLRRVCEALGTGQGLFAILRAPTVIHYSGHRIGARFPAAEEARVQSEIGRLLDRHRVGIGYGSLAAGADILFAEEILRRGGEVNLAFPFEIDEFKLISVEPSGAQWLDRFDACLKAAKTITFATTDQFLGDESLFAYATRIAFGLALLRAHFLDTDPRQMVVWDRGPAGGSDPSAGTGGDVAVGRRRGLPVDIIAPGPRSVSSGARKASRRVAGAKSGANMEGREIRAMLFGDMKGFSTLSDGQLPVFAHEIMGRFARVIDRHRRKILFRNTWGDGLYIVAADVEAAANCAMELQEEMASFRPADFGMPASLALRLGGHLGPVYRLRDPIIGRRNFIGAHVSRAARIEPVTPEGAVYVTEAFAAVLESSTKSGFRCEYVGEIPAAKHYGVMRMCSLRRSA